MQALLVVDFLQELPDQSFGFLEVAILGSVDFLVFESLDETSECTPRSGSLIDR
jgi:hypothetical protein